ncbi:MAG: FtsX-like permease family protein [Saprospiraceae bacterium]|nr:FtsX-like permease family protein [Saprospiraceae bacterium]
MILAIACVNYINLSLSRLIQRLREIGMRRILGAQNRQILFQMLTESVLYLAIALVLAIGLVNFFLPTFNHLVDKQLVLWDSQNVVLGLGIIGMVVFIAALVSLFPALALFRFHVGGILKSEYTKVSRKFSGFSFKNSFVIFQFTVAIGLIVATMIVQYQLSFIRTKDLGLQPDQTMVIPIRDEAVQQNFEAVKNTLSSISGVVSVSALSNFPWEDGFYGFPSAIEGQGKNIEADLPTLFVDEDFLKTMGMEISKGRGFFNNSIGDKQTAFLMNEAAAEKYGIKEVEGIRIKSASTQEVKEGDLIGIVKNFHMKSLHHPIDPIVLTVSPESYYIDNFVVRLKTTNLAQTIKHFSEKWSQVAPDRPFEYFFLDEAFAELYRKEARMGQLFSYFTILALFIACLGMFALAAFMSERRTKEIGIRKVLGANVSNIVTLLSKDFVKLVLVSVIFAFPIAWWAMNRWLQDFAYRIDIQWWMFVLAGVAAVGVALLTVSFQAIRAAVANPVESLRSE